MHPKRRFHLADEVRAFEEFETSSSTVFDVPIGIDVSIFVHALQKIQRPSLMLLLPSKSFECCCLLCWICGYCYSNRLHELSGCLLHRINDYLKHGDVLFGRSVFGNILCCFAKVNQTPNGNGMWGHSVLVTFERGLQLNFFVNEEE